MPFDPTKTSWTGDRVGRPLQAGDTSALAEFYASPGSLLLGLGAAAVGLIGVSHMSFWAAAVAVGLLALAGADFLYSRRNPIVSVYSSYLEIRPLGMWGRTHRISFAELGGWRQGSRFLCFETTASKKIFVNLRRLTKANLGRITALLESLKLGQPGFPGPTDADMARHEWKLRALPAAVIIALMVLVEMARALGIH